MAILNDLTGLKEKIRPELNLHHEFDPKKGMKAKKLVALLVEHIKSIKNPFDLQTANHLVNISTRREVTDDNNVKDKLLNTPEIGEELYFKFVKERLQDKTVSFHVSISFKYVPLSSNSLNQSNQKRVPKKLETDDAENSSAVNYLHYAVSRGKTAEYMLKFPITSRPIYLLESNSLHLKKAIKSDLSNILLKKWIQVMLLLLSMLMKKWFPSLM